MQEWEQRVREQRGIGVGLRRHWIGILGALLLIVGIVGIVGASVVGVRLSESQTAVPGSGRSRTVPATGLDGFSSNGERIYFTGIGHAGPIARAGGPMMDVACANCHGQDGRGGRMSLMMGASIDMPDIRYASLSTSRSVDGTTVPGWTDYQIGTAIRNGIEPNGQRMNTMMPRWDMDDVDMRDVISYLKELK